MIKTTTPNDGPLEPVIYDFDPRNLPLEMLEAIGLVVTAASQTESIVQELIGGLLGIDNVQTRALTAHMAAPLKDHVGRALGELSAPAIDELDRLDDLLDTVDAALSKRNTIVHNAIIRHPETGKLLSYRETARGSLRSELTPILVESVVEDALTIYDVGMDLMTFMMSRGIQPNIRTIPLRETLNRGTKARAERRDRLDRDRAE